MSDPHANWRQPTRYAPADRPGWDRAGNFIIGDTIEAGEAGAFMIVDTDRETGAPVLAPAPGA